jgi:hypothetical protein
MQDVRDGPRRVLPNLFSIPFGIAGLADVWDVARPVLATPPALPAALVPTLAIEAAPPAVAGVAPPARPARLARRWPGMRC